MTRRKKKKIPFFVILLAVIIILLFRLVEQTADESLPSDRFTVTKVVDGDTFEMLGGDIVRILSIDTPEKDELYYQKAKQLLTRLILGKTVTLEYADTRRDKYGRLLAYVYLDTLFINKVILENGLGYLYLFKDNEKHRIETGILLQSQRQAMESHRALWSLTKSPESFYLSKYNSFRLHRPGCSAVKSAKTGDYQKFSKREDGFWEGLSPCRNCKP